MKNKNAAALLALLLGGVGAHKFYLGKWVQGIFYILFCFTFVPAVIALVEAIVLFTMSEAAFQEKYAGSDGAFLFTSDGLVSPVTHVRCPDCREFVLKDARKCKHCGTGLVPMVK